MRKDSTAQSGIFNARVLVGFALFSVGALMAMLSVAATPFSGITTSANRSPGESVFAGKHAGQLSGKTTLAATSLPLAPAAGSWTVVSSPNTSPTANNFLQSVTCVSASDCWAAGTYFAVGGVSQTLVERWDGTSWAIVGSPNASATQSNFLYGVTCVSASECWAVGYYNAGAAQTLIERWDGTSWAIVDSPNTSATRNNFLYGVTCVSASECWAVGGYYTGSANQTLIERWDGISWAIVNSPSTSATEHNQLYGVTCASASDCWAVGFYKNSLTSNNQTLIERWDGTSWAIVSSPNTLPIQDNHLFAVTCVSGSECWAVGDYLSRTPVGFSVQTLIERWDGTSWAVVTSPNASTQVDVLFSVSCRSASDCWAAGYQSTNSVSQTLIEQWDGKGWTIASSADTSAMKNPVLHAVTCVPGSDCWAVGDYATATFPTVGRTLTERYTVDASTSASPVVIASTYLGGSGFEITWACATDSSGNVYIAGDAQAADFPVTTNALQRTYGGGGQDGYVAKYDRNGNLLWSTFLGGSGWDGVFGLTVDANGNAVVTGVTASTDFPITANAVQRTVTGDAAFVTVISADGTRVIYSTFLGGSQSDGVPVPINPFHAFPPANVETIGVAITVGTDGTLYVVGGTNAIDLPVTSGAAQPIIGGESDGFVARIRTDAAGSAGLMYLTYLGGLSNDFCSAVAADSAGNAFVTGQAQSLIFPTTLGAYQRVHTPGTVAFITKLNPTGSSLIYSTLLSGSKGSSASAGSNYTRPSAIAIDSNGHAYVDGETNDTDFPTTPGVVQPSNAGIDDGFVTELSADGSALVFSTYLGASDYDGLFALKLDKSGNIFVSGYTSSSDLPLVRAFQSTYGTDSDGWVAELSPGGTTLLLSSYLGGSGQDSTYGIDLWNNQLYIAGRTGSNDFPVTNSAPQTTYGGGIWDNFLTIVNLKPVQLVGAASPKTHGTAGTFGIDLPPVGNPGIECRSGGANHEYMMVFNFAKGLTSVGGASVTSGTGSIASSYIDSNDAHNYIVNLTGIANAQVITVSLSNVADSAGDFSNTVSQRMGVLLGDVDASGRVDSTDVFQVRQQTLQITNSSNFRMDIDESGRIDSTDVFITRQQTLTSLP